MSNQGGQNAQSPERDDQRPGPSRGTDDSGSGSHDGEDRDRARIQVAPADPNQPNGLNAQQVAAAIAAALQQQQQTQLTRGFNIEHEKAKRIVAVQMTNEALRVKILEGEYNPTALLVRVAQRLPPENKLGYLSPLAQELDLSQATSTAQHVVRTLRSLATGTNIPPILCVPGANERPLPSVLNELASRIEKNTLDSASLTEDGWMFSSNGNSHRWLPMPQSLTIGDELLDPYKYGLEGDASITQTDVDDNIKIAERNMVAVMAGVMNAADEKSHQRFFKGVFAESTCIVTMLQDMQETFYEKSPHSRALLEQLISDVKLQAADSIDELTKKIDKLLYISNLLGTNPHDFTRRVLTAGSGHPTFELLMKVNLGEQENPNITALMNMDSAEAIASGLKTFLLRNKTQSVAKPAASAADGGSKRKNAAASATVAKGKGKGGGNGSGKGGGKGSGKGGKGKGKGQQPGNGKASGRANQIVCFKCRKTGHIQRDCPRNLAAKANAKAKSKKKKKKAAAKPSSPTHQHRHKRQRNSPSDSDTESDSD